MNIALITAGGIGNRFGIELPKQFIEINGKPIIIRTLEHFNKCSEIDVIVIPTVAEYVPHLLQLTKKFSIHKARHIFPGGKTGQESILIALRVINEEYPNPDNIIVVHDSVRPIINEELILKNIESTKQFGNCVTVSNAIETCILKQHDSGKERASFLNRADVLIGKAPQCFIFKDILKYAELASATNKTFIDCASLMNYYGKDLHFVECKPDNIKITTPFDAQLFKWYINAEEDGKLNN